jgi:hypothetical protein
MSYFQCPDCGKQTEIFGKSTTAEAAQEAGLPLLGRLPIMPEVAQLSDEGKIEAANDICLGFFDTIVEDILKQLQVETVNK